MYLTKVGHINRFTHIFGVIFVSIVICFAWAQQSLAQSGTLGDPFTDFSQAYTVPQSGRYYFDVGGNQFEAAVDTSDGGGWVLVLQYHHQANTNPNLNVIGAGSDLPILSTSALGTDESGDLTRWGHTGNAAMSQFSGDIETRWYAQTSAHSRVINFKTTLGDDYLRTGSGNFSGISGSHTVLSGHTANIPANAPNFFSNQGDRALTEFPFWLSGNYHWGIKGRGNRWEVDDFALSREDTIHKVWARELPTVVSVSAPTQTCNVTAGSSSPLNNAIYWDLEGYPVPGGLRANSVPNMISSGSIVTQGLGLLTASGGNKINISEVQATNLDEARRNKEYIQQSFIVQSDFASYISSLSNWTQTFSGIGVDIATQADFSDAVNLYDGPFSFGGGWQHFSVTEPQLLSPGQTYYLRHYFYGANPAVTNHIDGWGLGLGSCLDFGDAPHDTDAAHVQTGALQLGLLSGDTELTSQHASAEGDDTTGADDEDGVSFPALNTDSTGQVTVTVTGDGYLQGWIDFNGNGSFADSGEQIIIDVQDNDVTDEDNVAGTIKVSFNVPVSATTTETYARLRWSSTTGLGPTGIASDGEIEDNSLTIIGAAVINASKTVVIWDPFNSGLYALPGNDTIYTIEVTHEGGSSIDAGSMFLVGAIPPNVTFYNGDIDDAGPETNAVQFTNSGSSLSFNFATDVGYSNLASKPVTMSECNYTPIGDYDENVTHLCVLPSGTFIAGDPNPSFAISFRTKIK